MTEGESGGTRPGRFSDDAWTTMIATLRSIKMRDRHEVNVASSMHPSKFLETDALKRAPNGKGK